jgi:gamma-glutamylcyclotransferase (GGCT)/AIG2-like uncharacterized protein YtfP
MSNTELKKHRVFVYGTLMRGRRNEALLSGTNLLGRKITKEKSFFMLQFESVSSLGNFSPGVFRKGQGRIAGELYGVDDRTLSHLDYLENNGVNYKREQVELLNGSIAWMYIKCSQKRSCSVSERVEYNRRAQTYSWN